MNQEQKYNNPHLGHGGFMMGAAASGKVGAGLGQYGMPYMGAYGSTTINWSMLAGGLLLLIIIVAIIWYYYKEKESPLASLGLPVL